MANTRIGIVSPMAIASEAVTAAFAELWPEAEAINLLDESLYADFAGGKGVTDETYRRVATLLQYSQDCGADGIVFTGSVFGRTVEAGRENLSVPVLTSHEAMIEAAFKCGSRFGILTTAAGSLRCLAEDIERYAQANGLDYTITDHIEDAARPVILAGDVERHDQMVAAAADKMTDCDCLLLGQFSMDQAVKKFADVPGRPVFTPPRTAVEKLKRLLGG
jgi:Asp/Glu/hydantoin racemase